jgi:predicted RNase H-like HicB family nuclease
MVKVKSHHDI